MVEPMTPPRFTAAKIRIIAGLAGVHPKTIYKRIVAGETDLRTLTEPARKRGPKPGTVHRRVDALHEAIWCERLGPDGPTVTQKELAARFGVTRQAVSQRERALRSER